MSSTLKSDRQTTGVLLALGAFGWWGAITPVYYHALKTVNVFELIAWRIVAGLPLLLILLWMTRRLPHLRQVLTRPRTMMMLVASALLIGVNWFVFIWAVDTDRLAEVSLGYYINPLVSVALGMLVLGERMRPAQWIAVAVAIAGVAVSAVGIDGVPWISLSLAGSFAFYGLVRKQVDADAAEQNALCFRHELVAGTDKNIGLRLAEQETGQKHEGERGQPVTDKNAVET